MGNSNFLIIQGRWLKQQQGQVPVVALAPSPPFSDWFLGDTFFGNFRTTFSDNQDQAKPCVCNKKCVPIGERNELDAARKWEFWSQNRHVVLKQPFGHTYERKQPACAQHAWLYLGLVQKCCVDKASQLLPLNSHHQENPPICTVVAPQTVESTEKGTTWHDIITNVPTLCNPATTMTFCLSTTDDKLNQTMNFVLNSHHKWFQISVTGLSSTRGTS